MAKYCLVDDNPTYQDDRTLSSLENYFKDKTDADISADIEPDGLLLVPDLGHSQPAFFTVFAELVGGTWFLDEISSVS